MPRLAADHFGTVTHLNLAAAVVHSKEFGTAIRSVFAALRGLSGE